MNKIFFLDAYALIFRSYYAFIRNPRITTKGLNTSAIFGFVNTLEELLTKEKPTHIGVAFDPAGPNFRHEMYSEYKANRESTPEDIKLAVPYIKDILAAYKIPVLQYCGFEADDVIGTLAKKFVSNENVIYMMTPDKDYAQLIENNIFMYKPARMGNGAEIIGINEIKKKYNIDNPSQVIDILSLWGDASDNIPGVPGIGEKTAAKLISTFNSIDNIYLNIDKITGKQKEALLDNKDQLYLAQKLVTIATHIPLDCKLSDFCCEIPDFEKLNEIFDELEFRTLKTRIIGNNAETEIVQKEKKSKKNQDSSQLDLFASVNQNLETDNSNISDRGSRFDENISYNFIETQYEIEKLVEKLSGVEEFCIDTETTGLDSMTAEIIGLAVSFKEKEAYYVNFPDDFETTKSLLQLFSKVFEDTNKLIIAQNLKYDLSVLLNYGIEVNTRFFDTMIAHYLLEPEQKHGLDFLSMKYLNHKMISIEELIGPKGKNQKNMRQIDPKTVSDYACEDADITFRLKNIFAKKLSDTKLEKLFYDIEIPLIKVLMSMERTGVKLDIDTVNQYGHDLKTELANIENKIYELANEKFNIASPKQLGEILFDKLKIINNPKKTKTKQYSTGEEELIKLVDKHPIINEILEYRSVNKLLNTYIDVLPTLVNPKTVRIHTTFNQAITATGRLSSNNPNLQNIPIRDERGREIRKSFIASDNNHLFFSADYSQIELRIMAHLSQDNNMLEAFNKYSLDIHTATAAKIFKVDEKNVTREMRAKAKTANFGIIYGISAFGLAQRLNILPKEAKELIDSYFEAFPSVKNFMEKSIQIGRELNYVETIFGRRRYLSDINSGNSIVRGYAERNAINAPIQGSAADIIKLAMVNINKQFEEQKLESKMILQVHDELNFDVKKSEKEKVYEIVNFEMQNAVKLAVPLEIESNFGTNWLEAH
ncbi:DNA polymerase I [Bacteroidales bacterium OttesenSCG-928-I21]|nr:DNA polymerase I [Bacteroidales bacterium OttesenSCG-928-I21]